MLSGRLISLADRLQQEDVEGVDVSNAAGGWHSQPTLFKHPDDAAQQLREVAVTAVTEVEAQCSQLAGCATREFELSEVTCTPNSSSQFLVLSSWLSGVWLR